MNNLKIIVAAVIVFLVALVGIWQLYKGRVNTNRIAQIPSPSVVPSGFPTQTPSPTSQALGTNVQSQPDSGSDTQVINNIGIFLDSPTDSQQITSPVKVIGRANVFEGAVQIRIKDANGKVLGRGTATACMGYDACPFEASIVFEKPMTSTGSVEAYSSNAVDGSKDYLQSTPVTF